MKVSMTFFLNEEKLSKKTAKVPMYLRIIINGKKAEKRLCIEATSNESLRWQSDTQRFNDKTFFANKIITNLENRFNEFLTSNHLSIGKFSAKQILDFVIGDRAPAEISIIKYIDTYYLSTILPNTQMETGTKKNYNKAINHLKRFLEVEKSSNRLLADLDYALAQNFKNFLLQKDGPKKGGMKETSAASIITKFRTIFDVAVNQKLIDSNPFKQVKLKYKSEYRQRLNVIQVNELLNASLEQFPNKILDRDLFLFSVFTGLAYKDSMELTTDNLIRTIEGETKLAILRTKTGELTEMILNKYALAIIQKYKHNAIKVNQKSIFPYRSNKELNVQIKLLAAIAEIPVKLSTHIARHTFRQLLGEAGVADMGIVKRMMGHSRGGDIDGVYYNVSETSLIEAKRQFEVYLSKYLEENGTARLIGKVL